MSIEVSGIFGFVLLVVSVWAIIRTIQSSAGTGKKTIWVVLILLLPVLGVIAWLFLGPRR